MASSLPKCRTIRVYAFRGDRSRAFGIGVLTALDDEKNGRGRGPTMDQCRLFAGHTGVSIDGGTTTYGFNPDPTGVAIWQMLDGLKSGEAFPGVVRDDAALFAAARSRALAIVSFEIILPDPQFQPFKARLDLERSNNQYSYGFPNGDGDCNCTTWLERLGLPLLTGRMDEFMSARAIQTSLSRRFGRCL
jgi:hypothetical protein